MAQNEEWKFKVVETDDGYEAIFNERTIVKNWQLRWPGPILVENEGEE